MKIHHAKLELYRLHCSIRDLHAFVQHCLAHPDRLDMIHPTVAHDLRVLVERSGTPRTAGWATRVGAGSQPCACREPGYVSVGECTCEAVKTSAR